MISYKKAITNNKIQKMQIIVEISNECDDWKIHNWLNEEIISEICTDILNEHKFFQKLKTAELSLLLTDQKQIRSLNNEFREKDQPTNVLSFPDEDYSSMNLHENYSLDDYSYLGDIAFCYEIIDAEAKNKSISFKNHFKHLLIHAILHLIGYDHQTDDQAKKMENFEVKLLENYGIQSPYI